MHPLPVGRRLDWSRISTEGLSAVSAAGHLIGVSGSTLRVDGLGSTVSLGAQIELAAAATSPVQAEVIGFSESQCLVMPYMRAPRLRLGTVATAIVPNIVTALAVDDTWIGRVLNPRGQPLDKKGLLGRGSNLRPIHAEPLAAISRARLGDRIDLGITALNLFATCRSGQRLGLFAGAGVGKSTLIGMLVRNVECDVVVVALVGERGREVREFLEDDLGVAGLARSIVVVATADMPPILRRDAGLAAMTIAEHFRDQGRNVLFIMDSVTRYCSALREIGMSVGELPAARGYPPSVFGELPRLLERAGPGAEGIPKAGMITAMFSVLVDGDDQTEPVADALRGILDGHVVLDRRIAERGRYPAIDVLRSLSRAVPGCNSDAENALMRRARAALALNEETRDLVRLGAYRLGSDPDVDEALRIAPQLEQILCQDRNDRSSLPDSFRYLAHVLSGA